MMDNNNIYIYNMWAGSKYNKLSNLLKYIFIWWRTIPCQIAFFFMPIRKKKLIISDTATYKNMVCMLIFFSYYRNLFYHRIGHFSYFFSWILPQEKSIILPFGTPIGESAHFVHNYGSHLNAQSIGKRFRCYQFVVIGSKRFGDDGRPVIGDNVTCGTGAVIVGNISIGNNVNIGANTLVNKSIPSNCTVIGNPARIIKKDGIKTDIPI